MDFLSRGGACKHLRASILWINWLRSQPPYPKYYQTLNHQDLPYVSLPTHEDAIKKFPKGIRIVKPYLRYTPEPEPIK